MIDWRKFEERFYTALMWVVVIGGLALLAREVLP